MPPPGFEPTISAGEQPQPHALHRAATATGADTVKFIIHLGTKNLPILFLHGVSRYFDYITAFMFKIKYFYCIFQFLYF